MSESLTVESRKTRWEEKTLGEVCKISSGNSAPQNDDAFENGTTPFIRTSDVGKIKVGRISSSRDYINQATLGKMKLQEQGTILLPKSGASTFLNHRVILDCDACVSSHLATIKTESEKIYDKYLFYFLITVKAQDLIQDHSYPSLRISDLSKIRINIPSLEEQKRIVDVLDKAFETIDKAIANTEANLASTKELFQSVLNDTFENKGDDWEEKTLGECGLIKGGKRVPKGYKLLDKKTKYPYLSVKDFNDLGSINISKVKYISLEVYEQIKRYSISDKDIYISIAGTIGKSGIIPKELNGANLTENACKIILDEKIINKFIYYFTLTESFFHQIKSKTRTTAQPKLALARLSSVELYIPSLMEQKRIVDVFDSLSTKTKQLEALYESKLASLKELKQSLLQKAFSGAL